MSNEPVNRHIFIQRFEEIHCMLNCTVWERNTIMLQMTSPTSQASDDFYITICRSNCLVQNFRQATASNGSSVFYFIPTNKNCVVQKLWVTVLNNSSDHPMVYMKVNSFSSESLTFLSDSFINFYFLLFYFKSLDIIHNSYKLYRGCQG